MTTKESSTFAILCWNIQKRSLTREFQREFDHLLKLYPATFIALQEVKVAEGKLPIHFQNFHHALNCNFRYKSYCYGVMTLSTLGFISHTNFTTRVKEAGVATKKSALLSRHRLHNGQTLALLNLHAINFVPHLFFEKELKRITGLIESLEDRNLIVAGDFNTWSKKRQKALERSMKLYNLERVFPNNETALKSVLGRPLDHIYYRGHKLLSAQVIDTDVSDHNPIYARFSADRESP